MNKNIPAIGRLPNLIVTGAHNKPSPSQPATVDNVHYVVSSMGILMRFNMMTSQVQFVSEGVGLDQNAQNEAEAAVLDVCKMLGIKVVGEVLAALSVLAHRQEFHPMQDWLEGLPAWDGVDHIEKLAASIKTDCELWPVFLENWLVQTVEAVSGWRRGHSLSIPHVLVLVGGQGLGKSRWLANLGGAFFKGEAELHLASASGKDHQIEALRHPMVELAELDGIFRKSDVSHMKSFISRTEDALRAPYARKALVRHRMTSFCGSVNEAEFLTDSTGSRRFWPVEVEAIDWGFDMDWQQLWSQALEYWRENPDFNLTAQEEAERAAMAKEVHTFTGPEEETLLEYLRLHENNAAYPVEPMNGTEVSVMLFGPGRSPHAIRKLKDALREYLGKRRKVGKKQNCWLVPYNEFARDSATWPAKPTPKTLSLV